MTNKKGFTLFEMVIVIALVGIIAIVTIPMVSHAIQTARVSADTATERAAQFLADRNYVVDGMSGTYYYDNTYNKLVESKPDHYGLSKANKNKVVLVSISGSGQVTTRWE